MTVKKLTASKRIPGRYYVDFYNGETLRLTDELVVRYGLAPERELTADEFDALRTEAVDVNAKSRALNILGAKMCSSGFLKRRLVELGETPDTAEEVCEWCIDMGLIDDAEYARQIASGYFSRGYGFRKIRDEFYRRRVPRELWDEALETLENNENAAQNAVGFIEKKLNGAAPDRENRRKIASSLLRRGFSWDEINSAFSLYAESVDDNDCGDSDG